MAIARINQGFNLESSGMVRVVHTPKVTICAGASNNPNGNIITTGEDYDQPGGWRGANTFMFVIYGAGKNSTVEVIDLVSEVVEQTIELDNGVLYDWQPYYGHQLKFSIASTSMWVSLDMDHEGLTKEFDCEHVSVPSAGSHVLTALKDTIVICASGRAEMDGTEYTLDTPFEVITGLTKTITNPYDTLDLLLVTPRDLV